MTPFSPIREGETIAHYRIERKLGVGGMGIVYKARHLTLGRAVALKFLPPHLAADKAGKQRFIHEAKAASALDHPNICTIYEIGQHEGRHFIAMACYDGETLQRKVERGSLPVEEALDYAAQMAEGLARAHEAGIIHRDLKPANVMVTERGRVKLLDFGVAKAIGDVDLTQTGATVGTAAYMSPEQSRGEAVDSRSDLWSLGVVLYEMLTGKRPFRGAYAQALLYQITQEEPEPIRALRPEVPEQIEGVVRKAMAKSPDERYQDSTELLADLRTLLREGGVEASRTAKPPGYGGRTYVYAALAILLFALAGSAWYLWQGEERDAMPPPSLDDETPALERLAVLPFTNIRRDPDMEYLGFALADQVIGALAYVQNVLVRPSTAVRLYEDRVVDAETAGSELKVDYVLTGNFLKVDDAVRLNVELVEVSTNDLLWREGIEVNFEDAFHLQDLVAEKVVDRLDVTFSREERARLQPDIPGDPLAYEYYLRSFSFPPTVEGRVLAAAMLEQSIALDSSYTPAWVSLGIALRFVAGYDLRRRDLIEEAEAALRKALSLNEESLPALSSLAELYAETGQLRDAIALLRRALRINPNSASSHKAMSYVLRYGGCISDAHEAVETAMALDPSISTVWHAALAYTYAGEYEQTLELLPSDPERQTSLAWLGYTHLRMQRTDLALEYLSHAVKADPESLLGRWAAALRAYLSGDPAMAFESIRKVEQSDIFDPEQAYHVGTVYGLLAEPADAARALNNAVEMGFFSYPVMQRDPFLDPVRDDPAVKRVLSKAKAKHEAFAAQYCTA